MTGVDDAARDFAAAFDRLGLPYAVMGGLAVRLHAIPRPTFDVDFTLAAPRDALPTLYREAESLGYAVPAAQAAGWVDTVRGLPVVKFQMFVGGRSLDVDVFLAETPYQHELLARRQRHGADGWSAWFVSAEDLVLLKLLADRPKDRADVADTLFIQGRLDEGYMRRWADRLGVRASWTRPSRPSKAWRDRTTADRDIKLTTMPTVTPPPDDSLTLPTAVRPHRPPSAPPGYELLGEVGRGGMGVVYRARDLALDREVAVKVLADALPPASAAAGRFVAEARITARLQHPGIPPVYHVGELADGRPFLAMKLIRGETLAARLLAGGPLDPLGVFEGIAQAVGFAHAQAIVHRDLKPQNVMVGPFGEVQVMDWGLAKVLVAGAVEPDEVGAVVGTPAYMAPEQARGEPADRRADVFGLGAVLCALLTGKPPYVGEGTTDLKVRAVVGHLRPAYDRLDECGADPDVAALCKRCLAADPGGRPPSANAVAAEVAELRRAAAGGLVAVLLAGVAGTTVGLVRAEAARGVAETAGRETDQRRAEAEAARQESDAQRAVAVANEKQSAALFNFFNDQVVAVARPKGYDGGLGADVRLRDALTASLNAIPKVFAGQPLVQARLRAELGHSFLQLGDPAEAVRQAAEAERLFAAAGGPDHPNALAARCLQGDGLFALGRYPEAVALLEGATARLTAAVGEDDRQTLAGVKSLAFCYDTVGRRADALRLWERAVAGCTARHGPDHPLTQEAVGYLATGYDRRGRHADAARLQRESLDKLTAKLGPDAQAVLVAANNLSLALDKCGRRAEALALREDVLARRRRALGPDHPSTLLSQNNLAGSYMTAGRVPEAAELYEDVVRRRTAKLGRDHPSTLLSLGNLADAYAKLGRPADALPLWAEAVELSARRPHEPGHLSAALGYAKALLAAGRGAEAVGQADAALDRAGPGASRRMVEKLLDVRLRHGEAAGDPAGCRVAAERWEKTAPAAADDLLAAACYRAVAARLYAAAGRPWQAEADAGRAVGWLTRAVAAGLADRDKVAGEDDLSALRGRADFRAVLNSLPELAPPPRPVR